MHEVSADGRAFLEARDFLLANRSAYEHACADFRWPRLERFNWARDYFDPMALGNNRPALRIVRDDGTDRRFSFAELRDRSDRVANALHSIGRAAATGCCSCCPTSCRLGKRFSPA